MSSLRLHRRIAVALAQPRCPLKSPPQIPSRARLFPSSAAHLAAVPVLLPHGRHHRTSFARLSQSPHATRRCHRTRPFGSGDPSRQRIARHQALPITASLTASPSVPTSCGCPRPPPIVSRSRLPPGVLRIAPILQHDRCHRASLALPQGRR
ncbi:hypothetical protein E2562_020819 [Oryza meyeriana var. granulata]|uniref:Uncharacterized protein n=1 Tax=Oryza meyeriana var. granulata TaxID=110450 RepID=A0A6G1CHL3_9ORYZ|nr:hypothetical protein E2562_020819 [Oryza meyeriana var. granulata]